MPRGDPADDRDLTGERPPPQARIGTSGWQYRHWKGIFYPDHVPQRRWLEYYQEHFDTVEINNSFYRLPTPDTVSKWRETAPPDFLYAVKASRYLTHMKRLKDPQEPLERIMGVARGLGHSCGPLLFQLPPRFRLNLERLEHFLAALPPTRDHVLEFRDPSWHTGAVYQLLEQHGAALCLHDAPDARTPVRLTTAFTYVRFHGPGKDHTGDYPAHHLDEWAERISAWTRDGIAVYAYFNNDPEGWAVKNALELKRKLTG